MPFAAPRAWRWIDRWARRLRVWSWSRPCALNLDGGATSASMTRSGSGAAGAATAIAGSTADAGAALDGAALAGALSNAWRPGTRGRRRR